MKNNTVICVVGPTACGKTRMGVLLAKACGGEVVSCDSMQLYRGMVIGTAAPTPEETEGVPHHMVGVADPHEDYSVARYVREAGACVDDVFARGRQPILVGGTGLYLDALLSGRDFAPGTGDGEVRAELEERFSREGAEAMLEELRRVDPESAARLPAGDRKRIIRALEVWRVTGKTISQHNRETQALPPRYQAVRLGFTYEDRADLRAAIDARVDGMMEAGLLDEVRALLDSGVPRTATAFAAIGYKECLRCLDGACSAQEAAEEIRLRSRQYAKRQLTWLRHSGETEWYYWKKTRDFQSALAFSTKILTDHGVF